MSELNNEPKITESAEEQSSFNFQTIYTAFILNWKWFIMSIIICVCFGFLYLRYATPVYNTSAKLLIKDDSNDKRGGGSTLQALESMSNLGIISNNYGIENELEILTSTVIAEQAIRDLRLYVNYYIKGNIKKRLVYKTQPINVDMDYEHLEKLNTPMKLKITKEGNTYKIKGTYYIPENEISSTGPFEIEKDIRTLASYISIRILPTIMQACPDRLYNILLSAVDANTEDFTYVFNRIIEAYCHCGYYKKLVMRLIESHYDICLNAAVNIALNTQKQATADRAMKLVMLLSRSADTDSKRIGLINRITNKKTFK